MSRPVPASWVNNGAPGAETGLCKDYLETKAGVLSHSQKASDAFRLLPGIAGTADCRFTIGLHNFYMNIHDFPPLFKP